MAHLLTRHKHVFRRGTSGKIQRYLSKWSCLAAAVISNCPAGLFISHRHILDIHRQLRCVEFKVEQAWRACFSFRPDRSSKRIYHHFRHKCCHLGGGGGRMTKAETPSYNLKEQQHGRSRPSKPITINRLNAVKRTVVWE